MPGICPNCGVGGFHAVCEVCKYEEGTPLEETPEAPEPDEDEDED